MTFEHFALTVKQHGLSPHDCGHGHWQIRGGPYLVNFYSDTKRGDVFYVNGMTRGKHTQGAARAIAAAYDPPWRPRGRRKQYTGYKRILLAQNPKCHWCSIVLTEKTATVDHLIPLSRGGSNGVDNLALACSTCNQARGNSLGAPK